MMKMFNLSVICAALALSASVFADNRGTFCDSDLDAGTVAVTWDSQCDGETDTADYVVIECEYTDLDSITTEITLPAQEVCTSPATIAVEDLSEDIDLELWECQAKVFDDMDPLTGKQGSAKGSKKDTNRIGNADCEEEFES